MIFGLALSICALTPVGKLTTDSSQIETNILAFGFSFLILISIWLRYTGIMSVLPVETATGTILNVIMLFCVSLEPYLFNLLNSLNGYSGFSSAAYAVDLGTLFAILALLTHQLTTEERNLIPIRLLRRYRLQGMERC